jgi:hypothetical protein
MARRTPDTTKLRENIRKNLAPKPKPFSSFRNNPALSISLVSLLISGWTAYTKEFEHLFLDLTVRPPYRGLTFSKAASGLVVEDPGHTLTFRNEGNRPVAIQEIEIRLQSSAPDRKCYALDGFTLAPSEFKPFIVKPGEIEVRTFNFTRVGVLLPTALDPMNAKSLYSCIKIQHLESDSGMEYFEQHIITYDVSPYQFTPGRRFSFDVYNTTLRPVAVVSSEPWLRVATSWLFRLISPPPPRTRES